MSKRHPSMTPLTREKLRKDSEWIRAVAGNHHAEDIQSFAWIVEDATITATLWTGREGERITFFRVCTGPSVSRRYSVGHIGEVEELVYSVLAKRGNASAAIALEAILDRELEEVTR